MKIFAPGIDDRLGARDRIGCNVRANNVRPLPVCDLCGSLPRRASRANN
jgi:hypothetical protein